MVTPEHPKLQAAQSYGLLVRKYARQGEIPATERDRLETERKQLSLTVEESEKIENHELKKLKASHTYGLSVRDRARNGEISLVQRALLEQERSRLKLTPTEAKTIENYVLQQASVAANRAMPDASQRYRQEFLQAIQLEFPPGQLLRRGLKQLQQDLRMTDEAVGAIESETSQAFQAETAQYRSNLRQYEQAFSSAVSLGLAFDEVTQSQLAEQQKTLGLRANDVTQVEGKILSQQFAELQAGLMQTELLDAPVTQILPPHLSAQMAPTLPPAETSSFISGQDMLSGESSNGSANGGLKPASALTLTLHSAKGVDYTALSDLLQSQQWQEADRETLKVMLQAADRTTEGWLDPAALTKFPCEDLKIIDSLWKRYSAGQFGFTAQWHVYPIAKGSRISPTSNLPARIMNDQVLEFARKVGWWTERLEFLKYYNQLNFTQEASTEAPPGHLPALWFWTIPWWKALQIGGVGATRGGCSVQDQTLPTFMTRLKMCSFE